MCHNITMQNIYNFPSRIYFKQGALCSMLTDVYPAKKTLLLIDEQTFHSNKYHKLRKTLIENNITNINLFITSHKKYNLSSIRELIDRVKLFNPELVIAFGNYLPIKLSKYIYRYLSNKNANFKQIIMPVNTKILSPVVNFLGNKQNKTNMSNLIFVIDYDYWDYTEPICPIDEFVDSIITSVKKL